MTVPDQVHLTEYCRDLHLKYVDLVRGIAAAAEACKGGEVADMDEGAHLCGNSWACVATSLAGRQLACIVPDVDM